MRLLLWLATRKREARALEDTIEAVVVARRDRVVFVIVAPCTAEREAKDGLAKRVDCVLKREVHVLVDVMPKAPRDGKVTCGGDALGELRPFGGEQITCDLLADEFVVGLVLIKRSNDPIPVAPCVRQRMIGVFAGGVCVAHDIKPMPSPLFPVRRRF